MFGSPDPSRVRPKGRENLPTIIQNRSSLSSATTGPALIDTSLAGRTTNPRLLVPP